MAPTKKKQAKKKNGKLTRAAAAKKAGLASARKRGNR